MPDNTRGILPLTGDGITFGHLDLIDRAATRCTHLTVAFLENPNKAGTTVFIPQERFSHAEYLVATFLPQHNITVITSNECLTDCFLRYGCDVVFRGIRTVHDRQAEERELLYHEQILPGITARTVFIEANPALAHIESTVVRRFAEQHFDASAMVPLFIQARLWRKLHGQKVVGITGTTTPNVRNHLEKALTVLCEAHIPAHHISLTELANEFMCEDSPGIKVLQQKIGRAEPNSPESHEAHALFNAHLYRHYRHTLKGRQGVILVSYDYLVEDHLNHWVNNNVIVITDEESTAPSAPRTFGESWPHDRKHRTALERATHDHYGLVLNYPLTATTLPEGLGAIIEAKVRSGAL